MKIDFLKRMAFAAIALFVLVIAISSVASAQSKKQPRKTIAFNGTVYSSIDGSTVIRMISSDELEIERQGTNLVCKYTKQGDVIRAVVNSFGTTQAVYYQTTPEGLQDKEGLIFYSPARLETARQQAAAARQQAVEQARLEAQRKEEAGRRAVALYRETITPTKVISTYETFFTMDAGEEAARETTVSDVNVSAHSKGTPNVSSERSYGFGTIRSVIPGEMTHGINRWYVAFDQLWGRVSEIYFKEKPTRDKFVSEVDTAIKAWRAKYPAYATQDYRGIEPAR
jgi:hypothetical protein